jgi:Protein of unknown function (DUF3309)
LRDGTHPPIWRSSAATGADAMLFTILIILVLLALIGGLPTWGYSHEWGYAPSGGLALLLIILIILALASRPGRTL